LAEVGFRAAIRKVVEPNHGIDGRPVIVAVKGREP
jgi:hypothetical protein